METDPLLKNCFPKAPQVVHKRRPQSPEHVVQCGPINSMLLKRECWWIYTLGTLNPKGLNEDFVIKLFL